MTRRTKFDGYEYDSKLYKSHVCPFCASYVLVYADGTHNAHCIKHGKVTYVSMIETDVPLFREAIHSAEPPKFGSPLWFAMTPEEAV